MKFTRLIVFVPFVLFFVIGCSTTTLTGSWKDPEYTQTVNDIYIVGISKNDTIRRSFEDAFRQRFLDLGINAMVSYKDFPADQDIDKDTLMKKARNRGSDSILLTRMVGKRTETVVTPGRVTTYSSGSYYYDRHYPYDYYRSYGTYYPRRYDTIYDPPTVTQFKVATIEANIYDTGTGELIWTAQLETTSGNLQKRISDFIDVVFKDLMRKALV